MGFNLQLLIRRTQGQLFVGAVLSHLHKQKTTETGAVFVRHDMEELYHLATAMKPPETQGILECVDQNPRHLTTTLLLLLVQASYYHGLRRLVNTPRLLLPILSEYSTASVQGCWTELEPGQSQSERVRSVPQNRSTAALSQ